MTEEKRLSPAERKKQTTNRVNAKIAAFQRALESRSKDRFHGLPKSLEAFNAWRGEGNEESLGEIHRQTLNSRKELKEKVQEILEERKNTPEEDVAKKEARIKELENQIKGLASANHEKNLEIDRLNADLSLRGSKIEKLEAALAKPSLKVRNIRDKR